MHRRRHEECQRNREWQTCPAKRLTPHSRWSTPHNSAPFAGSAQSSLMPSASAFIGWTLGPSGHSALRGARSTSPRSSVSATSQDQRAGGSPAPPAPGRRAVVSTHCPGITTPLRARAYQPLGGWDQSVKLRIFPGIITEKIGSGRAIGALSSYSETIPRLMAYWINSAVVWSPSFFIRSYL